MELRGHRGGWVDVVVSTRAYGTIILIGSFRRPRRGTVAYAECCRSRSPERRRTSLERVRVRVPNPRTGVERTKHVTVPAAGQGDFVLENAKVDPSKYQNEKSITYVPPETSTLRIARLERSSIFAAARTGTLLCSCHFVDVSVAAVGTFFHVVLSAEMLASGRRRGVVSLALRCSSDDEVSYDRDLNYIPGCASVCRVGSPSSSLYQQREYFVVSLRR